MFEKGISYNGNIMASQVLYKLRTIFIRRKWFGTHFRLNGSYLARANAIQVISIHGKWSRYTEKTGTSCQTEIHWIVAMRRTSSLECQLPEKKSVIEEQFDKFWQTLYIHNELRCIRSTKFTSVQNNCSGIVLMPQVPQLIYLFQLSGN